MKNSKCEFTFITTQKRNHLKISRRPQAWIWIFPFEMALKIFFIAIANWVILRQLSPIHWLHFVCGMKIYISISETIFRYMKFSSMNGSSSSNHAIHIKFRKRCGYSFIIGKCPRKKIVFAASHHSKLKLTKNSCRSAE